MAEDGGLLLPEAVRNAGTLTPYAVETRYPGSWTEIAGADVDEALRIAEQTIEWARGAMV